MARIHVDFTDAWLDYRFLELRGTINLAERLLQEEAASFEARVKATAAQLPEEERQEFYAFMSSEYSQIHETSPNLLRRALFLVCYTEIEAYMKRLCRLAQQKQDVHRSLDQRKGRGIRGARRYLTTVAGVSIASDNPEWQRLIDYTKLRHVLAHTEGRLTDARDREQLETFVDRHPYLKLDAEGYIIIGQGFCEEVINTALRFFKQLPAELRRGTPGWRL